MFIADFELNLSVANICRRVSEVHLIGPNWDIRPNCVNLVDADSDFRKVVLL